MVTKYDAQITLMSAVPPTSGEIDITIGARDRTTAFYRYDWTMTTLTAKELLWWFFGW
jgi:hypothetical protein